MHDPKKGANTFPLCFVYMVVQLFPGDIIKKTII